MIPKNVRYVCIFASIYAKYQLALMKCCVFISVKWQMFWMGIYLPQCLHHRHLPLRNSSYALFLVIGGKQASHPHAYTINSVWECVRFFSLNCIYSSALFIYNVDIWSQVRGALSVPLLLCQCYSLANTRWDSGKGSVLLMSTNTLGIFCKDRI